MIFSSNLLNRINGNTSKILTKLSTNFTALLILLAMAATSTINIRKRLGQRWQQIHYGVYVAGILGVWHYWWQVKLDIEEPLVYAGVLGVLLGYRLWSGLRDRRRRSHR